MTLLQGDCLERLKDKGSTKKYGLPYMGSKSSIVKDLLNALPSAENFYDLFGGGGCVTHYAMENCADKWKTVHYNELDSGVMGLVRDAIAGKYSYENFKPPFISRDDFFKNKDTCAYTRCVWSFGNNQKTYLFGKDVESRKRSLHNAVIFDDFNGEAVYLLGINQWPDGLKDIRARRLYIQKVVRERKGELQQLQQLQQLERLEQLERLQQLQQLQQLERLERLSFSSVDYADVLVKPNSIIYCDIPYKGTRGYLSEFDYDQFFNWAANHQTPVFISEYEIADSRFTVIFQKDKIQKLTANSKNGKRRVFTEKVYANRAALEYMNAQEIAKKRIGV